MAQDEALSRQIRRDFRQAALAPQDRAMLEYVEKLAKERYTVTAADHERLRQAGFTNGDILDITLVVANFMLANTLTDAFELEYHENLHHIFVDESTPSEAVDRSAPGLETLLPGDEIWMNSRPVAAAAFRGRPVLLYYWDWTHPGSLEGLPYLEAWSHRYAAHGVAVLLALAPEFPFAREPEAARRAVERLGITLPVVLLPSYRTWRGANNTFWPALYLLDATGELRHKHNGPGGYAGVERAIQELLRDDHRGLDLPDILEPSDLEPVEPEPGTPSLQNPTPQAYAVYDKGRLGHREAAGAEGQVVDFVEPPTRADGLLYVSGRWYVRPEGLELVEGRGVVSVRFQGAGAAAVLGCPADGCAVRVMLDGAPAATEARGRHEGRVLIEQAGLYELFRGQFGTHDLRLECDEPGFVVYALSFTSANESRPAQEPVLE